MQQLKTYEVQVEMRVRRTMRIRAQDKGAARELALGWLQIAAEGKGELSSVLKWTDGREAYRTMPVETVLLDPEPVFSEPVEIE